MTEHTLYQKMIKGVFFICAYYDKVYTADKRIQTGQTKIKTKNGNLFYLPYCHIREMRSNNSYSCWSKTPDFRKKCDFYHLIRHEKCEFGGFCFSFSQLKRKESNPKI